jgi:hypothetical protein
MAAVTAAGVLAMIGIFDFIRHGRFGLAFGPL